MIHVQLPYPNGSKRQAVVGAKIENCPKRKLEANTMIWTRSGVDEIGLVERLLAGQRQALCQSMPVILIVIRIIII